jgi:outer membrane protein OmpA-like peptidoglycan-associated protein/opacity protein-like surface antigen
MAFCRYGGNKMKSRLLIAAASAALMAAPSIASADDTEGWYLRGNAGYGIHTDIDLTGGMTSEQHGNGLQSEGNVTGSLGLGYDFGNNWRLELDGASLWTDFGSISQIPSTSAKFRTNTGMLNAIYDFDDFGRWEPYVGAGIGLVQAKANLVAQDFVSPGNIVTANPACVGPRATLVNRNTLPNIQPEACAVSDKDISLGYQLLAGLGYDISDNLKWDTHYRYLDAGEFDFDGVRTNQISGGTNPFTVAAAGIGAHSLMTGFRYLFGEKTVAAPPPPPPPPPAPVADYRCWDGSMVFNAGQCPAQPAPEPQPTVSCWDGSVVFSSSECPAQPQTYTCWDGTLVYDQAQCPAQISQRGNDVAALCSEQYRQEIIYYEFDKGQSAETRNTINRILDIGQYCNVDNIRVVGHTDRSGSAAYNLALSKRRAKDARDELVRQGIAGERITSEGKGETEPFVPTADGVKEQLNRRTEVLISLGSVGVIN